MQRLTCSPEKHPGTRVRGMLSHKQRQCAPRLASGVFLPLTLVLANDESAACRAASARCLSQMLSRAGPRIIDSVLRFVKQWLRDADAKSSIRCAAAQVVSIAAESCPLELSRHIQHLFHLLGKQLQTVCDHAGMPVLVCCGESKLSTSAACCRDWNRLFKWDVAFHALIAIEKLVHRMPAGAGETRPPPNPGISYPRECDFYGSNMTCCGFCFSPRKCLQLIV